MSRWKIIGEVTLFLIHALTGLCVGWTLSLGESSLERLVSMTSATCAFIFFWGISRRRGETFFFLNIKTVRDGALYSAVLAVPLIARHYAAGDVLVHPALDWLLLLVTSTAIGALYGRFAQIRRDRKVVIK
ncbi:MAG: hypothetical protein Fur0022_35010 [Anaerolineales bacterium]